MWWRGAHATSLNARERRGERRVGERAPVRGFGHRPCDDRRVPTDEIHVIGSVRIPRREIEVITTTSGGPGGQHANRSATKVELRYDVATSHALSEAQRRRVIERIGREVRVAAGDERSRARNLALAEQRLVDRLKDALEVPPARRATRPSRGARARRLDEKRQRSQLKSQRRRPRADD